MFSIFKRKRAKVAEEQPPEIPLEKEDVLWTSIEEIFDKFDQENKYDPFVRIGDEWPDDVDMKRFMERYGDAFYDRVIETYEAHSEFEIDDVVKFWNPMSLYELGLLKGNLEKVMRLFEITNIKNYTCLKHDISKSLCAIYEDDSVGFQKNFQDEYGKAVFTYMNRLLDSHHDLKEVLGKYDFDDLKKNNDYAAFIASALYKLIETRQVDNADLAIFVKHFGVDLSRCSFENSKVRMQVRSIFKHIYADQDNLSDGFSTYQARCFLENICEKNQPLNEGEADELLQDYYLEAGVDYHLHIIGYASMGAAQREVKRFFDKCFEDNMDRVYHGLFYTLSNSAKHKTWFKAHVKELLSDSSQAPEKVAYLANLAKRYLGYTSQNMMISDEVIVQNKNDDLRVLCVAFNKKAKPDYPQFIITHAKIKRSGWSVYGEESSIGRHVWFHKTEDIREALKEICPSQTDEAYEKLTASILQNQKKMAL